MELIYLKTNSYICSEGVFFLVPAFAERNNIKLALLNIPLTLLRVKHNRYFKFHLNTMQIYEKILSLHLLN